MAFGKDDVQRLVDLLQDYSENLTYSSDTNLQRSLNSIINMCQSELFTALIDIHEYQKDVLQNNGLVTPALNNSNSFSQSYQITDYNNDNSSYRYDASRASYSDEHSTETILLVKDGSGLGFSISGGKDTPHYPDDPSIYITKIIPNGAAATDGRLRVNDCLVKVMDRNLDNVSHEEAVEILKSSPPRVLLTVKRMKSSDELLKPRVIEVTLNKGYRGLGISIAGGQHSQHIPGSDGIYITKIILDGAADKDGTLQIGDRILCVNDVNIEEVTHDDAVEALKGAGDTVTLVIAQNAPEVIGSNTLPYSSPNLPSREPRRVVLEKGPQGLGFNIIGVESSEGIFVSYVLPNGVADVSSSLKVGDQILEVNGEDMQNAAHEDAANMLKSSGKVVSILVRYNPEEYSKFDQRLGSLQHPPSSPNSVGSGTLKTNLKRSLYVRALFDYDKTKDPDLPGPGLSFRHGDILHVINAADDEWWQARRVGVDGQDEGRGVIPSKKRVEKKERSRNRSVKFSSSSDEAMRMGSSSDNSVDAVYTYEPVVQTWIAYMRPVIVLGPLKDRVNDDLIAEFPDRFGSCVPHTTRPKRENEIHGRDYFFVSSRAEMERDIQNHLFIEAGQFNENLYGTSISSVRDVSDQGKHCILDVSGYAIKRLRQAQLYPIVVFLRPLSTESISCRNSRMSEELAKKNFERAMRLEHDFKHYFTACVSVEPGRTYDNIYGEVKEVIKQHAQPACWITSKEKI